MTAPEVTVVQLTDTHIVGADVHKAVDTYDNLTRVLARLVASNQRIDALVLSGDLTDSGAPEAYQRLRDAVEPAAQALGAAVIYAMGNHDERGAFARVLLGGSESGEQPLDSVYEVRGLRIVVLDSTTPGRHEGRLEPEQLAWLREQLATPAPLGTLLVLHHPPIPSVIKTSNFLRLYDADELADVVAGSDVRMIVCGHNHFTGAAAIAGIPVWVGPPMSYRSDPLAPVGRHRGIVGYGFSRIDVVEGTFLVTHVEATPTEQVYDNALQDVLDMLADLAGQAR